MEIIRSLESLNPLQGSVLTLGSYDGIHRGHREILSSVVNDEPPKLPKSISTSRCSFTEKQAANLRAQSNSTE